MQKIRKRSVDGGDNAILLFSYFFFPCLLKCMWNCILSGLSHHLCSTGASSISIRIFPQHIRKKSAYVSMQIFRLPFVAQCSSFFHVCATLFNLLKSIVGIHKGRLLLNRDYFLPFDAESLGVDLGGYM